MSLRQELCNKGFRLQCRLRLFNATVSQTLLYGAGTWTLNAEREAKLRTAQRRMIRSMLQRPRRREEEIEETSLQRHGQEEGSEEESTEEVAEEEEGEALEQWHDWCKRVTKEAAKEMQKAGVEDWAVSAKRNVWTLAGHIPRRDDG